MYFQSFELFLTLTGLLVSALYLKKLKIWWLVVFIASTAFYGKEYPRLILLLLFSGALDYFCALQISKQKKSEIFLYISICTNILVLVIVKSAYLIPSFNTFNSWFHGVQSQNYLIPLGVSFYTFQSMSFTIDVYKKRIDKFPHILEFFSYLTFFPQLVAGPIVRAKHFLPQLSIIQKPSSQNIINGTYIFLQGLFLKSVIADNLGPRLNAIYNINTPLESSIYWIAVTTLYTIYIYTDFAGYSKMAIGISQLLGFKIPLNFNNPFISLSVTEYWKRWHISLTEWFRDYVFYPIIGTKITHINFTVAIFLTFALSGVWHGFKVTFIMWGILHAIALSFEHFLFKRKHRLKNTLYNPLKWILTFTFVVLSMNLFASMTLDQAWKITKIIFSDLSLHSINYILPKEWFILISFFIFQFILNLLEKKKIHKIQSITWKCASISILIPLCIFFKGAYTGYVYFNF